MDVREKLVELLYDADKECNNKNCDTCKHQDKKFFCKIHFYIDKMIANGVTVQEWIPVTERLPEEHDCFFTSYYGTNKWQDGMFRQISDTVLAVVEYEDGKIRVKATVTKDGKWDFSKFYRASKVTHWMPLPQPPKGE